MRTVPISPSPARSAIQAKTQPGLQVGGGGLVAVSIDGDYYFPSYDNNGNVIGYWNEDGEIVGLKGQTPQYHPRDRWLRAGGAFC